MKDLLAKHKDAFEALYKLYSEFNSHTNISSITDKEEVYKKHFEDSLTILPYLSDSDLKLIDIGTGGGFPALPLAIVFPNLQITAIDSVGKKIKFLELVKKELGLENLEPIARRAEELAQEQNYREQYDLALSRAVAELRMLLEYSMPFVKVKGNFIAYKKQSIKDEITAATKAIHILGCKLIDQVAYDDKQLLVFEKLKKNSSEYPRSNQLIKKNPL
jgi:16S rRNA (guanine527-N7)-methyltransferase